VGGAWKYGNHGNMATVSVRIVVSLSLFGQEDSDFAQRPIAGTTTVAIPQLQNRVLLHCRTFLSALSIR
jgi:hypothetical protein